MRKLLPLTTLVLCAACVVVGVNKPAAQVDSRGVGEFQLLQADRDFAEATHARGIEGWMSFFADDAIRIKYRGGMVKGYNAVRAMDTPLISDTTITLNWQPLEAYVFKHGTTGITIGTSQVVNRIGPKKGDVTYRGRYTTLWRREPDGRWRVIMDTGYPDAGG